MFYTLSFVFYFSSQMNFLSKSFFYTQYLVLTFSIDVVFTLSKVSLPFYLHVIVEQPEQQLTHCNQAYSMLHIKRFFPFPLLTD